MSHLRRLQGCEKVAAVCYRMVDGSAQFLLVRTRGGRWTFPKGSVEPGLTHAQAAALEAYEEAGVHGRMEECRFARYKSNQEGAAPISAHLCEVLRLGKPQESGRDRTWFPAGEAKRRLREGRKQHYGAELARVVDKAVRRIQVLHEEASVAVNGARTTPTVSSLSPAKDAMQRVQFEAPMGFGQAQTVAVGLARYLRRVAEPMDQLAPGSTGRRQSVLQLEPAQLSTSRARTAARGRRYHAQESLYILAPR